MGRYDPSSQFRKKAAYNEAPEVHPIWRGIGFILMVITPIMGYAIATVLIQENAQKGWVAIPPELLSPWLHPYLFIYIGLTLVIALALFMIFQLFTFIIYRLFGPSRYGPLDAPPIKRKVKRSR